MKALVVFLVASSCGSAGTVSAVDRGRELAASTELSGSPFNQFSCTTCHQVDPADTRKLPGYSLLGATKRPSYWGGAYFDMKSSVDFCLQYFMQGDPIDPKSDSARALYEYLASLGDKGEATASPLAIKLKIGPKPPADTGDCARGKALHAAACQGCHGPAHGSSGGIEKSPQLPDQAKDEAIQLIQQLKLEDSYKPWEVFEEKIRHGRFFLVGGFMPPFSETALSEQDVEDLLWYYNMADQQTVQCPP